MIDAITKAIKDADYLEYSLDQVNSFIQKLGGVLLTSGCRLYWYYKEDAEYAKHIEENIEDMDLYSGIVVPKEDVAVKNLKSELEMEDCLVVMDQYPVQKTECEATWMALCRLLSNDDLVKVYRKDI